MHWEKSVLSAANRTVNALLNVPETAIADTLSSLGGVVAGRNLLGNEFVAINEAISNILRDEISQNNVQSSSSELWAKAVRSPPPNLPKSGKHALNSLIHFDQAPSEKIICPGDVWTCENWVALFERAAFPSEAGEKIEQFKNCFIAGPLRPKKLYALLEKATTDADRLTQQSKIDAVYKPYNAAFDQIELAMIEISPACDFSNNKKSLKSLALGCVIPMDVLTGGLKLCETKDLISCKTQKNGKSVILAVSAKYLISLSSGLLTRANGSLGVNKIFRMRESLLALLGSKYNRVQRKNRHNGF